MSTTYTPREGSVPWKTIEFLTTNPDECLTADDISAKFDAPRNRVHTLLGPATHAGILVRAEDLASGELVYRLGTGSPSITPNAARHPTLSAADPSVVARPRRAQARPFDLDLSRVEIVKGQPLPTARGKRRAQMTALLERLTPGDSFVLPAVADSTLRQCVLEAHRAKDGRVFAVRKLGADQVGCWRTS